MDPDNKTSIQVTPRGTKRQDELTERKRKTFTSAFKAKVGLEVIRGVRTTNEMAQAYAVHPVQMGQCQQAIIEGAGTLLSLPAQGHPVNRQRM